VNYAIRLPANDNLQRNIRALLTAARGKAELQAGGPKCPLVESLPMKTLDSVVARRKMPGPILLKADVQGYELEVLRGANETLRNTEVILLEVSTLPYNIGAPLFSDVVAFVADRRFLIYDFCHLHRRQSDDTAFQVDVLFAREDSALRSEKRFFVSRESKTRTI